MKLLVNRLTLGMANHQLQSLPTSLTNSAPWLTRPLHTHVYTCIHMYTQYFIQTHMFNVTLTSYAFNGCILANCHVHITSSIYMYMYV